MGLRGFLFRQGKTRLVDVYIFFSLSTSFSVSNVQLLAYTFEQMRMEKDALLQYEELEAFVHIEQNLPKKVNNSEVLSDDVAQELQIRDFLQRLRLNQVTDQELYQRLFERQSHFHLLSKRMIDALVFARKFIVSSYKRFIDDGDARGISLAVSSDLKSFFYSSIDYSNSSPFC